MTKYKFDYSDEAIRNLIHEKYEGNIRYNRCSTPDIINIIEALKLQCKTRHTWKITEIRKYCEKIDLSFYDLRIIYNEYRRRKKQIVMLESILDKEIEKRQGYADREKARIKNSWNFRMIEESEYKPLVTQSNEDLNEFISGIISLKRRYFPKTKDIEMLMILWNNIESEKEFTSFNDFKRFYYDSTKPEKRRVHKIKRSK